MLTFFRTCTLLAAIAIFACSSQAQQVVTPVSPAVAAEATSPEAPLEKALLWRIETPGTTGASYLFGTIHLIAAEDFLLSDSLMAALNRSERVVFEIDPAEMKNPATAMSLMTKAMMTDGSTLRTLLSEEDYAKVDAHFSAMGLPMMFLDRIKPMFLGMLAGLDPSDMGGLMGGGSEEEGGIKSYELELDEIARASDKQVSGLETTDFQIGLFDSIPYPTQAKMLMDAINAPADQADELAKLTEIYVTGDIDGMYDMTVGEDGGLGGFERMLIVNRNLNWIAPIKEQIAVKPTLFAVGAGHLGGPDGVVRLLRAEGLSVTPVSVR